MRTVHHDGEKHQYDGQQRNAADHHIFNVLAFVEYLREYCQPRARHHARRQQGLCTRRHGKQYQEQYKIAVGKSRGVHFFGETYEVVRRAQYQPHADGRCKGIPQHVRHQQLAAQRRRARHRRHNPFIFGQQRKQQVKPARHNHNLHNRDQFHEYRIGGQAQYVFENRRKYIGKIMVPKRKPIHMDIHNGES